MKNVNRAKLWMMVAGAVVLAIAVEVYWVIQNNITSPLCERDSCINKDAKDMKCDRDVKTIERQNFEGITIELRHSAKCDASWARANVPSGTILYIEDQKGYRYAEWTVPDDDIKSAHYGNMGPGQKLKACAKLPSNPQPLCTNLPKANNFSSPISSSQNPQT